jgi:hypothetical protein
MPKRDARSAADKAWATSDGDEENPTKEGLNKGWSGDMEA